MQQPFGGTSSGAEVPYRAQMEAAFGEDFSGVRAHLGASAEMRAIGARGAARGETIAFADGHPSITDVAHELTHVVQHRRHGGDPDRPSRPQDAAEREAEMVAQAVAQGEPAPRIQSAATPDASTSEQAPQTGSVASGDEATGTPADSLRANDPMQAAVTEQAAVAEQEAIPEQNLAEQKAVAEQKALAEQEPGPSATLAPDNAPPRETEIAPPGPQAGPQPDPQAGPQQGPQAGPRTPTTEVGGTAMQRQSAPAGADASRAALAPPLVEPAPGFAAAEEIRFGDLGGGIERARAALRQAQRKERDSLASSRHVVIDAGLGEQAAQASRPPTPTAPSVPQLRSAGSRVHEHANTIHQKRADAHARKATTRTSAGPRPQVALQGPADPMRTERARAGLDVTATVLQTQQRQAAAADFGEHAVVPTHQPVALEVAPRTAMPELELAEGNVPAVSSELAAALDQKFAPIMQQRMRTARREAEARSVRMDGELQATQGRGQAQLAQLADRTRADRASAQARAGIQVEGLRMQWRTEADALASRHSTEAHALQQARLARSEQVVTSGEERVAGTLAQAEQQGDSERSAAEERAARIMADARAQAAAASQRGGAGVMRRQEPPDGGTEAGEVATGDAEDGMAILAEAEALAQETLAQAEVLIQQLIDAAQTGAYSEVLRLQGEIETLLAELDQELAGASDLLEARMPLVAESFTTRIDAVIASVNEQVQAVDTAIRSGQTYVLQDMEDDLSTRMYGHQQKVGGIFDEAMHDLRVVETAEAISARCMNGDAFQRDASGNLQTTTEFGAKDNSTLQVPIANLTPAEYLILFEAASIQTGVPVELLKGIAHGEAMASATSDNVPRQFVEEDYLVAPQGFQDGAALGGRALDGMRWFGIPVPVGVDAGGTYGLGIMQHTFSGGTINGIVPDGVEGAELYEMLLAQAGDAKRTDANLGGFVPTNIARSIVDPYNNIMQSAELLKHITASFINGDSPYFNLIAPDIGTYPDGTPNSDAFYGEGPEHISYPEGYDPEHRDAWGLSIIAAFYNGAEGSDLATAGDPNTKYAHNIFSNMTNPDDPAYRFVNAEPIVSSNPDIPIPLDYATVDGQLYQFTPEGLVPAENNIIEIDGARYVFDEASGQLIPADLGQGES